VSQRIGFEVLFHQFIIRFGGRFDQHQVQTIGFVLVFGWYLGFLVGPLVVELEHPGLHIDQVDDAFEIVFCTHRHIDGDGTGAETFFQIVDGLEIIGPLAVEFVDKSDARYFEFVHPLPERIGLGLDAIDCRDDQDRSAKDA